MAHMRNLFEQRAPVMRRWPMVALVVAPAIGCCGLLVSLALAPKVTHFPAEHIVVDGVKRTFRVIEPPRHAAEQLPVVYHFHGHGNYPESEADRTRLDQLAASRGFVLVYPAAISGSWSIGHGSVDENCDIRFFDALLDHLVDELDVDRKRVYITGMSMGASFVHELASARSSKIAAAVAHSGSASSQLKCDRPLPIMIVVGANETTTLDASRQYAHKYRNRGHVVELLVVQGIGHEWSQKHNLKMWRFLSRHRLTN